MTLQNNGIKLEAVEEVLAIHRNFKIIVISLPHTQRN